MLLQSVDGDIRVGAFVSQRGEMRTFGRLTNPLDLQPVQHAFTRTRSSAMPVITMQVQR